MPYRNSLAPVPTSDVRPRRTSAEKWQRDMRGMREAFRKGPITLTVVTVALLGTTGWLSFVIYDYSPWINGLFSVAMLGVALFTNRSDKPADKP